MVGNLYEQGDPKRDSGFNIFYMGINIGAFVRQLPGRARCATPGAGLRSSRAPRSGMLIGVLILLSSWKTLERADRQPERSPDDVGFGSMARTILLPAFSFGVLGYFSAKQFLPGSTPCGRRCAAS